MEGKKKGVKLRTKSSRAAPLAVVEMDVPDCFNSDNSGKEDFWGFPLDFAECDIPSSHSIHYTLHNRGNYLFPETSDDEDDFEGFTQSQVYVY